MALRIEKRSDLPRWQLIAGPVASVALALLLGAVLLALTGHNPLATYSSMLQGSVGNTRMLAQTVVRSIPLALCALGVGLAMRMQLWNIGAEGQLALGAIAAGWLALFHPQLPPVLMLPGMFILGFIAGGLWAVLAVLPRVFWGISEIMTTLMLNYVAILLLQYLVHGPWRDPRLIGFPLSAVFPAAAALPILGNSAIHLGLVLAVVCAVAIQIAMGRTTWGYEITVTGESARAARYAGMNVVRNILLVMFLSGGLAGLAGMVEVSGVIHRLQETVTPGTGYSAIIIASLARRDPIATLLISFLFGSLVVGGYAIQSAGVSASLASMLQGAILLFVLGSEFFTHYRVHWIQTDSHAAAKQPETRR